MTKLLGGEELKGLPAPHESQLTVDVLAQQSGVRVVKEGSGEAVATTPVAVKMVEKVYGEVCFMLLCLIALLNC